MMTEMRTRRDNWYTHLLNTSVARCWYYSKDQVGKAVAEAISDYDKSRSVKSRDNAEF